MNNQQTTHVKTQEGRHLKLYVHVSLKNSYSYA